MTHKDLNIKCKQIDCTYIYEHTNPIYKHKFVSEIQMYVQNSKILCNMRYIKSNYTISIALENQRTWLYFTPYEQTILL